MYVLLQLLCQLIIDTTGPTLGTPSYVGRIKKGQLPLVLRNLHIPAIILNSLIMLLVLAVVPLETVLGGANVLSVLAQLVCLLSLYLLHL